MSWADKIDIVRHVLEAFFYLIAGPLLSVFAIKSLKKMNTKQKIMDNMQNGSIQLTSGDLAVLEERIKRLEEKNK